MPQQLAAVISMRSVTFLVIGLSLLGFFTYMMSTVRVSLHLPLGISGFSCPTIADSLTLRLLIFQHFPVGAPDLALLHQASQDGHRRYAQLHGYDYASDLGEYVREEHVDEDPPSRHSNKAFAILHCILDELDKGDNGAEWIL